MRKTNLLGLLVLLLCLTSFLGCGPRSAGHAESTPGFSPTPSVSPAPSAPPAEPGFVEAPQREGAPMGLTTADGTGLKLVDLHAQAVLDGPLAFTELHLTFENPEDRVLEGRFEITLPEKAAISRFAMKIDDQWQEAEMVERQAAQRAYEDFLHRRQDPALLEKEAGNEFRARIFPIPAKGRKEILISYSQELESSSTPYVLPLQGLPQIANMLLEVRSGSSGDRSLKPEIEAIRRQDFQPTGDFMVPQDGSTQGLTGGDIIVARVHPQISSTASIPEDLLILVDTSASRSLGFADQVEMVSDLLKSLPKLQKVTVAAFDQKVDMIYQGDPAAFSAKALLERKALGATDLQGALAWAAKQKGHTRLLLITDGITTAGTEKFGEALQGSGLKRLDVIMVGGIRDKDRMEILVADTLESDGGLFNGDLPPSELARKLSLSVNSGLDVSVQGAKWVWPLTLDNVQPGDDRLIYAQMTKPTSTAQISLGGAAPITIPLRPAQALPLLSRSAVVAQIARLESLRGEATDAQDKERMGQEIIALSISHRVLSDLTALLVLETEADYQRFSIDRKALVDILQVGPQGLVLKGRPDLVLPGPKKPKQEKPQVDGPELGEGPTDGAAPPPPGSSGRGQLAQEAEGGAPASAVDRPMRVAMEQVPASRAAPSGESPSYTNEVDSSNYLVAQTRTRVSAGSSSDEGVVVEEREIRAGAPSAPEPSRRGVQRRSAGVTDEAKNSAPTPLTGPMAEIEKLLKQGKTEKALEKAWAWHQTEPGNVLALLALGDCLEAKGDKATAARVYGSIIDLFPSRADLRRFAGSRLQKLGVEGLPLAVDSFTKAVAQRPDHPSSHRFLAFGLARQGQYEKAFTALEAGLAQDYPEGRFAGNERLLKEDLGLLGAAWAAKDPKQAKSIASRLREAGVAMADKPSMRFVLTWETDANDVDFHIMDANDGHAFYGAPILTSGGELFADVTTGYGPECFAIPGNPQAFPYRLQIHYYARGPMGYGMGQLEILQHDGKGNLSFEERPYVVMTDGAYVDLGVVKGPLKP